MTPASLTAAPVAANRLNPGTRRSESRGGMTLIELVIVASLLVMLAAIAIPTIRLAVEGRRVREAARSLNVYLGSARNRAMATGRPVGVMLRRFENDSLVCFTLDQIETPPPYAGDTINARAFLFWDGTNLKATFVDGSHPPQPAPVPKERIQINERIRFNCQGFWYRVANREIVDDAITNVTLVLLNPDINGWKEPPTWSVPVPFEVHRLPSVSRRAAIQASIAKPLQLPLDAVVDMTFSGWGAGASSSAAFASGTQPVVIIFSPNGGVEALMYNDYMTIANRPGQMIYLLVGKRERIPPGSAEDGLSNLQDLESLWIVVNPRTGLVNTVENAPIDPNDTTTPEIVQARRFSLDAQSVGGR